MAKIIIRLEGGLVQEVLTDVPADELEDVEVRDYDVEGADEDELEEDSNGFYAGSHPIVYPLKERSGR